MVKPLVALFVIKQYAPTNIYIFTCLVKAKLLLSLSNVTHQFLSPPTQIPS